jgi:Tfp pilus assembly protein PilF
MLVAGARHARRLDAERWAERGDAAAARGATSEARAAWQRTLDRDAVHPGASEGLARLDETAGDSKSALARRTSIATAADDEGWPLSSRAAALRNAGITALRAGQLDAARTAFERQRALGASTLETDLTLAAIELAIGDRAAAARSRDFARNRYGDVEPVFRLELATQAPTAKIDDLLVFLRLRRGDETSPTDPEPTAPISRAVAAQQATRRGDIAAAYEQWSRLRDGSLAPLAGLEMAKLDLAAARPAAALDALAERVSGTQVPCEARQFYTARALQALGRLSEARAAASRAVECNPLAARSLTLLGTIESASGDAAAAARTQQSVRALEASLAAQSTDPDPAR